MASNDTKMFTVDKFLGVNESVDGETELKMGEASRMENFQVTDAMNLALRPGILRVDFSQSRSPAQILASWAGYINDSEYLCLCDFCEERTGFSSTRYKMTGIVWYVYRSNCWA